MSNAPNTALEPTPITPGSFCYGFTDDKTQLAVRKARKQAKDDFRKSLPESINKIYGAITSKFGTKGAETTQCFPQGRTVFTKSTDDALQNELQTLVNGVTANQAQLGAQAVTD